MDEQGEWVICGSCSGNGCRECKQRGEVWDGPDYEPDEPTEFPPLDCHRYYDGTGRGGW